MTLPFFSAIRRYLKWAVLAAAVLFVLIESWLCLVGWPRFTRRILARHLAPAGGSCQIGWMRGTLLFGIELENLAIHAPSDAGQINAVIPSLAVGFNRLALLRGKIIPGHVRAHRVSASILAGQFITASGGKPRLHCNDGELNLALSANRTMKGRASFKFHGATIGGEIDLANYQGPRRLLRSLAHHFDSTSFHTPPDSLSLQWLNRELEKITLGNSDAHIRFELTGDLASSGSLQLYGWLDLTSTIIHGVVVPKLRGEFNLREHRLEIRQQLLLSMQETINAEAVIDLTEGTIMGNANGAIMPASLLSLTAMPPSLLPSEIVFADPVNFSATLPKSYLTSPQSWRPEVDFTFNQVSLHRISFHDGSGVIAYDNGKIHLRQLKAALDYRNREIIRISASYDCRRHTISGAIQGRCNIRRLVGKYYSLRHSVLPAEDRYENFTAVIDESPIGDWRQIRADAEITRRRLEYGVIRLQDLRSTIRLRDGQVVIPEISAGIAGSRHCRFSLATRFPLKSLLSSTPVLTLPMQLRVDGEGLSPLPGLTPVLEAAATVKVDFDQSTLSITNGSGRTAATPLGMILRQLLHSGDPALDEFLAWTRGWTMAPFTFAMPPWEWDGASEWAINGDLAFDDWEFMTVPLDYGSAKVAVSANALQFTEIDGRLAGQEKPFSIERIAVDFQPVAIKIDNIRYQGPPEAVEPFVHDAGARDIYRRIWHDVTWMGTGAPQFFIRSLQYHDLPGGRWSFTLDGNFHALDACYRELHLPQSSCDIRLDLPGNDGLRLENIRVAAANATNALTARAIIRFDRGISGEFEADFRDSGLDLLEILRNAIPPIAPALSGFTLDQSGQFQCHGSFDTSLNTFNVDGTMVTAQIQYRNFSLNDVDCSLGYGGDRLSWNLHNARLRGGRLFSSGEFNLNGKNGKCVIDAQAIPLAELAKLAAFAYSNNGGEAPSPDASNYQGAVSINASTDFFIGWANQPFLLDGYGHLELRNADLWRIPLLTTLGKLLSAGSFNFFSSDAIAKLGSISKLNADMEFRGRRIDVSQLMTNGTVIALLGSGRLDLTTREVDFVVSSELLSAVRFISWPLRPLAWAFEARLVGTIPEISWKLQSTIRKYFSTKALD